MSLLCWLALVALAVGVGSGLTRRMGIETVLERITLSATVGLGSIATLIFALGLVGLVAPVPVGLTLLVAAGLGFAGTVSEEGWKTRLGLDRRHRIGGIAVAAVAVLPFVALALYPSTGFDANVYHLPAARAFAEGHRLAFLPNLRTPVFPQLWEMLLTVGLLFTDEVVGQLLHLSAAILTGAVIFVWGRGVYGVRVGLFASALWVGTPLVMWIGASAYVDLALSLFVAGSLYAWQRWERGAGASWIVLSGVLIGFASATKYLGLFFLGYLFAMVVWKSIRLRCVRPPLLFVGASNLVAAPTYLRIFYYTGNPLFPFYQSVFGGSEWSDQGSMAMAAASPSLFASTGEMALGIVSDIPALLLVPWNTLFAREVFNFQAPLSPFLLVLLPLCLPFSLRYPSLRRLLLLVVAYGVFWLTTVQDIRYLLPALPVLCLGVGVGVDRWLLWAERRVPTPHSLWTAAIVAVLLAPGYAYALYKLSERGAIPLSAESREDYLVRQVPEYEPIGRLNRSLGDRYTVYTLYGEHLNYLAEGGFRGDWSGPGRFARVLDATRSGDELYRILRELGADHFLVLLPAGAAVDLPDDCAFRSRFRLVAEEPAYLLFALEPHRESM